MSQRPTIRPIRSGQLSRRDALAICGSGLLLAPSVLAGLGRARFSLAIGVCRGPGDAATAKSGGAEYLEVGCHAELRPGQPDDEVVERLDRLRSLPLPALCANGFLPGRLQATGPDADHDAIVTYSEVAFRRASSVGIDTITFGSSGARTLPEGFGTAEADLQFVALLARLAGPAADSGITVCVEPLRRQETNYINRVAHAARLVGAVDHPAIGITADVYHMLVEDEGAGAISAAGSLVRHVHIAEERDRRPPGTSGEDFAPYLSALRAAGFSGRVSIECRWENLENELANSVRTLRDQIGSA